MIKPILMAAALSLAAATAAWAMPIPQSASLRPLNSSDLIQVGKKGGGGGKHHGGGGGKHHGGGGGKHHGGGGGKHHGGGGKHHGGGGGKHHGGGGKHHGGGG